MWIAFAFGHVPVVYTTSSNEDWCQVIEDALGGDYVMLESGTYTGPCDIVVKLSDPPGEITLVQSLNPGERARFVPGPGADYILSLSGDFGVIQSVDFLELAEGITAVELRDGRDLGVSFNTFTGAGTGVRQVGMVESVSVRDNLYIGYEGLAADVGCGGSCLPSVVKVLNNVVDGGGAPMKLWSVDAHVVDNTAVGASGRLFDVHVTGSAAVTGNALQADEPFAVSGVATVTANLLIGAVALDQGQFAGNTLVGEVDAGAAEVFGNATVGTSLGDGNLVCDSSCFMDLDGLDLYPAADSPLIKADPGAQGDDWCGRARVTPGAFGAFEYVGEAGGVGPITPNYKSLLDCRLPRPELPVFTDTSDTGTLEPSPAKGGCGCHSVQPVGSALEVLAHLFRRRGR